MVSEVEPLAGLFYLEKFLNIQSLALMRNPA
jgi:hypothetical protein